MHDVDEELLKEQEQKEREYDEFSNSLDLIVQAAWETHKHRYPDLLSYRSWRI
jgi:hypothetical protein